MCEKWKKTKMYKVLKQAEKTYDPVIKKVQKFYAGHKEIVLWAVIIVSALMIEAALCGGQSGKIAVINTDRVQEEAEPYKTIVAEQQKYEELWKMKFLAEKEPLDQEDQRLAKAAKSKKIKPAALKREVEALQKKALALQTKYQKEAAKIYAATKSVVTQVDKLMLDVAADVAKENGYDIVLSKRVIYASDNVDMTDKLIKALNKKALKIEYPDPETLTPNKEE